MVELKQYLAAKIGFAVSTKIQRKFGHRFTNFNNQFVIRFKRIFYQQSHWLDFKGIQQNKSEMGFRICEQNRLEQFEQKRSPQIN